MAVDLSRLCECDHPISSHYGKTPNRDLVKCVECHAAGVAVPCLIHLGAQPARIAKALMTLQSRAAAGLSAP